MTPPVPPALTAGGRIVRRQTTFWDVVARKQSAPFRIHFVQKAETDFRGDGSDSATVSIEHPVLVDYQHAQQALFVSSPGDDPDAVLLDLNDLARDFFRGWRKLERYLNPYFPARAVLEDGTGVLLRGPEPFIAAASDVLARHGVRVDPIEPGVQGGRPVVALHLGESFIVAEELRFEATGPGT